MKWIAVGIDVPFPIMQHILIVYKRTVTEMKRNIDGHERFNINISTTRKILKDVGERETQNGEKWDVKTKRNGDELLIEARR